MGTWREQDEMAATNGADIGLIEKESEGLRWHGRRRLSMIPLVRRMEDGEIEAIPTAYAGRLYPSRLRARWAVFFDALYGFGKGGWSITQPPFQFVAGNIAWAIRRDRLWECGEEREMELLRRVFPSCGQGMAVVIFGYPFRHDAWWMDGTVSGWTRAEFGAASIPGTDKFFAGVSVSIAKDYRFDGRVG